MNPYMPGRTVDPVYFAGRDKEVQKFEMFYRNVKQGNSMNLAIQGERGIGKTSLMRYLEKNSRNDQAIVVRIDLDLSYENLNLFIKALLTKIRHEAERYSKLFKVSESFRKLFQDRTLSLDLFGASLQWDAKETIQSFEVQERLQQIWEKVSVNVPAILIMIDEAECLESMKGALQYLRNLFSRLAEEKCGYMLILSGKLNLFQQIKQVHSPLARFFNPIQLEPLDSNESREALLKPLQDSQFVMDDTVIAKIIHCSEGHPYIIQVFGFYLCEYATGKEIDLALYHATYPLIFDGLASQFFADTYHFASDNEKKILCLIANHNDEMVRTSDIAQVLKKEPKEVGYLFERLVEKNCLVKVKRGQYKLFHELFRQYLIQIQN